MRFNSWIPSWNRHTTFTVSLLAALAVHAGPVCLKWVVDDVFDLDAHGLLIVTSLILLQTALTMLPGRRGFQIGFSVLSLGFLFSLFNVMNIVIFKSPVSVISLASTVQSNAQEVQEFLETYGTLLTLSAGFYLALSTRLMQLYSKAARPLTLNASAFLLITFVVCLLPTAYRSHGSPRQMALNIHELFYADRLVTTFVRYQDIMRAREKARAFWSQRADAHPDLKVQRALPTLPSLVVVVIGESTTRRHMGVYGYHRPTTPRLEAMRSQLILFTRATAPVASTLHGVIGALCSAGFDQVSLNCEGPTLIEIARAAGYETSWISNQAPSGFGDNFIVELGRTADHSSFVNQDVSSAGEADASSSFDEKILGPLDRLLQSPQSVANKRMIFVHLMGAHFVYEKRYPKAGRLFESTHDIILPESIKDPKAKAIINHYDNAIAYQDKVLGGILDRLQASGEDAVFAYYSDHGEEVYNTDSFAGHSEDRPTPAMREVPFILGYTEAYALRRGSQLNELKRKADRPFSTFQLTPSVAGFLGLSSEEFSQRDNIFSESFQPQSGVSEASSSLPSQPPRLRN